MGANSINVKSCKRSPVERRRPMQHFPELLTFRLNHFDTQFVWARLMVKNVTKSVVESHAERVPYRE